MIHHGFTAVDNVTCELTERVFTGQDVQITLIEPPDKLLQPEPIPLEIVFEDAWLLVVNKSAGLVAHPVGEFQTGTLCNAVQFHLDQQTRVKGLLRPGIVHRLDRMTSGLTVLCKEHLSHRNLSIAFQQRRVSKSYLAIVEGRLKQQADEINLPIGRAAGKKSILMSCRADALDAKPARTQYQVLKQYAHYALIRAIPLTGRVHQIRVHFAQIGHPVLGDAFYAADGRYHKPNPHHLVEDENPHSNSGGVHCLNAGSPLPTDRHALHAWQLAFAHPITHEWMEWTSCLPDDFCNLVAEATEKSSECDQFVTT